MGNGRQSHTKTSAAEQRVPTNWRQHSPKVDTVTCNKINNTKIYQHKPCIYQHRNTFWLA